MPLVFVWEVVGGMAAAASTQYMNTTAGLQTSQANAGFEL